MEFHGFGKRGYHRGFHHLLSPLWGVLWSVLPLVNTPMSKQDTVVPGLRVHLHQQGFAWGFGGVSILTGSNGYVLCYLRMERFGGVLIRTTGSEVPSLQRKQALKASHPPVAVFWAVAVICKRAGEAHYGSTCIIYILSVGFFMRQSLRGAADKEY